MRCALSTRRVRQETLPVDTIRALLEAIRADLQAVPERLRTPANRTELRAVAAALRRLQEGTYGTCEDCHGAIPVHYLLAVPLETRCEPCGTIHRD